MKTERATHNYSFGGIILKPASKVLIGSLLLALSALPAAADTISDISFMSNGGSFINDTIINGTSPLGVTATTDLAQPFLNSPDDSNVNLGFGSYYLIAFSGQFQMIGPGTVSFMLSGVTDPFTQEVTFPDPTLPSAAFASFALPGNESLTIAATGLSADRIAVVADAGGLSPDGAPDAYYLLTFSNVPLSAAPEPATLALFGAGLGIICALRRRHSRQN
jgi:hypothetical protein